VHVHAPLQTVHEPRLDVQTILEPSPIYFWTSSEPDTRMNLQSV
jgi:hypothetical protein